MKLRILDALVPHVVPGITWTRELVMQNLAMTARAFDHLAEHAPGCRAIFASSAFVYAPTPDPVREDAPFGSIHPYALSKQLGEAWKLGPHHPEAGVARQGPQGSSHQRRARGRIEGGGRGVQADVSVTIRCL